MTGKSLSAIGKVISPIVFLLIFVMIWQLAVMVFKIPPFLLPGPFAVVDAAIQNISKLTSAVLVTGSATVLGLAASSLVGLLIGIVFAYSPLIRFGCYPYAIFLQTVPIVAIAPIIITWFGYGFPSVVIVAFVISLFPMITATTTGMLAVERDLLDLFRLYQSNWWQTLFKLRLPFATRFIITGLKTSSGLAVVGAIVGEYFAGHDPDWQGLGYYIFIAHGQLKTALLYSAVFASTLLGVGMFAVVNLFASTILSRWYDPTRNE